MYTELLAPLAAGDRARASTSRRRSCACGRGRRSCSARPGRRRRRPSSAYAERGARHHLRRRVPARGGEGAAGRRRLRPARAGRVPGRADHPALLAAGERGPRPQRRGRLPPQGVAAAPPGAARRDARALRLRRLRLPPAGRDRGGPRPPTCAASRRSWRRVPEESIVHHAGRNHFSRWLKARTEFALAHELRPRRLEDYESPRALRESLHPGDRRLPAASRAAPSSRTSTATTSTSSGDFYRMGGGSLGGKARGLAFVRRLLAEQGLRGRFPGVEIARADLGRARHRRLRPLPRRQRPALLRDRVRGRRRDPGAASAPRRSRRRRSGTWRRSSSGPPGPSRCAPRACSRTRSTSRSPASTTR